jgi:hypothetical protein
LRAWVRFLAVVLLQAVAEAPGFGAGVDDLRSVGEPVDDGLGERGVLEDLGPFAEGEVGRDELRMNPPA